ncbi:MAG: hypothetical protein J5506_04895 [Prevotella sp.]|nr:hypothetical protein [Prevotella sp.]
MNQDKIELRSEKVKRIVGKMPRSLILVSTIVLAVLYTLLAVAAVWWYVRFL